MYPGERGPTRAMRVLDHNISTHSRSRRAAPEPTAADRLLDLAHRLERLGRGARGNPETLTVERHEIAGAMRRIAREVAA